MGNVNIVVFTQEKFLFSFPRPQALTETEIGEHKQHGSWLCSLFFAEYSVVSKEKCRNSEVIISCVWDYAW